MIICAPGTGTHVVNLDLFKLFGALFLQTRVHGDPFRLKLLETKRSMMILEIFRPLSSSVDGCRQLVGYMAGYCTNAALEKAFGHIENVLSHASCCELVCSHLRGFPPNEMHRRFPDI